uniref:Uncharacterized protein n=1 Tax=Anguilla anguilla TaxID=7936 RepID=A0A0E9RXQ4_ANGAN
MCIYTYSIYIYMYMYVRIYTYIHMYTWDYYVWICYLSSSERGGLCFNLLPVFIYDFFSITGNLKDCCVFVNNGHRVHCACERLLS